MSTWTHVSFWARCDRCGQKWEQTHSSPPTTYLSRNTISWEEQYRFGGSVNLCWACRADFEAWLSTPPQVQLPPAPKAPSNPAPPEP